MRVPTIVLGGLAAGAVVLGLAYGQDKPKLTIESWRNDDLKIWQTQIIPAFNKKFPNIEVTFAPSAPTEYNAALDAKLQAGSAGDLITCRPFDKSLELFQKGQLEDLASLKGMENFSGVAKSAWQTDDAKSTFCVPMASVIHGFIYNKKIFTELKLKVPNTEAEFYAALETIRKNGKYAPLVMGTKDQWESATMGYQNIGPNYWAGETGRKGLIAGTAKYNTGGFLKAFEALAKWRPYLAKGYQSLAYPDAQNLFSLGRGAIYPAGSWDISTFRAAKVDIGAFKPPLPQGVRKCQISDHTDIAMGMNAASPNKDAARTFLEWMTTEEFASIYSNALPGFFSLNGKAKVKLSDPVAQEFVNWRGQCDSTIRSAYQILSRNEKINNENDLWGASAAVLNGTKTPKQAADEVQKRLESWYKPK